MLSSTGNARASQIPVVMHSTKVTANLEDEVGGGGAAGVDTEEPRASSRGCSLAKEGGYHEPNCECSHCLRQITVIMQQTLDAKDDVIVAHERSAAANREWREEMYEEMARLSKTIEALKHDLQEKTKALDEKNKASKFITKGPITVVNTTISNNSNLVENVPSAQPPAISQVLPVKQPSKSSMKRAANALRDLKKLHGIDGYKIMDDLLLKVEERYPELNSDPKITAALKEERFKGNTTHNYVAIMMVYPGTLQMMEDAHQVALARVKSEEKQEEVVDTEIPEAVQLPGLEENILDLAGDPEPCSALVQDSENEEFVDFEDFEDFEVSEDTRIPERDANVLELAVESPIDISYEKKTNDEESSPRTVSCKLSKSLCILIIALIAMFGSPFFTGTLSLPSNSFIATARLQYQSAINSIGISSNMFGGPQLNWNTCANDSNGIPEFPRVPLYIPTSHPDEAPKARNYKKIFSKVFSNVASAGREYTTITSKDVRFGVIGIAFSAEFATPLNPASSHPKLTKSVRYGAIGVAWIGEWIWA